MKTQLSIILIILALILTSSVVYAENPAANKEKAVVESLGRINDIDSPYYMLCFYEVRDQESSLIGTGYGRCPSRLSSGKVQASISPFSDLGELLSTSGLTPTSVPVINYNHRMVFDKEQWFEQVATSEKSQ